MKTEIPTDYATKTELDNYRTLDNRTVYTEIECDIEMSIRNYTGARIKTSDFDIINYHLFGKYTYNDETYEFDTIFTLCDSGITVVYSYICSEDTTKIFRFDLVSKMLYACERIDGKITANYSISEIKVYAPNDSLALKSDIPTNYVSTTDSLLYRRFDDLDYRIIYPITTKHFTYGNNVDYDTASVEFHENMILIGYYITVNRISEKHIPFNIEFKTDSLSDKLHDDYVYLSSNNSKYFMWDEVSGCIYVNDENISESYPVVLQCAYINTDKLVLQSEIQTDYVKTIGNSTISGDISLTPNTDSTGDFKRYIQIGSGTNTVTCSMESKSNVNTFTTTIRDGSIKLHRYGYGADKTITLLDSDGNTTFTSDLTVNGTFRAANTNTTIMHYCPIEQDLNSIDNFVVGAPVYLAGKVYKYDNKYRQIYIVCNKFINVVVHRKKQKKKIIHPVFKLQTIKNRKLIYQFYTLYMILHDTNSIFFEEINTKSDSKKGFIKY